MLRHHHDRILRHAGAPFPLFRDAGEEVSIWFHGVGVTWLAAFNAQYDQFTRHYGSLFDSLRDNIGGACDFCTRTRFGAAEAAQQLGVPIVGGDGRHHTAAALTTDGYQVLIF